MAWGKVAGDSEASSGLRAGGDDVTVAVVDALLKHDLPERFDPMTTKELRQSLRRGSFVIPFLAIQALAVAATTAEFYLGSGAAGSSGAALAPPLMWESGFFWMVVGAICILIMPLTGILLMKQELDEGNHELLQLTKLSRWKIVLGKFVALWGLSALTFVSLLPYVVVRYMVGGVEWWYELACAATVVGGAAILSAGAIGASAFANPATRGLVLLLFLGSALVGCGIPLAASGGWSGDYGIIYHVTALAGVICYVAIGLALARSRLRMTVAAYEVKPSGMILVLLVTAPFAVSLASLFTLGKGGVIGLLGITWVALKLDVTPRAPKRLLPTPNVPPRLPAAGEAVIAGPDE